MPVIREYRQQVGAPGPVQKSQYTADQLGAQSGKAMQQAGGVLSDIGDTIAKRIEQDETSDVAAKLTKLNADYSIKGQELARTVKPGDKQPFVDLEQEFNDELSALGEGVSTPAASAHYAQTSEAIRGQFIKTSSATQAQLSGIKAVDDLTMVENNATAGAMAEPSSYALNQKLMNDAIDNYVNSGQLSPAEAMPLRTKSMREVAKANMRGWADLNPDHAKKKLDSGEFDSALGADGKAQMYGEIDQAIRAKEIEAERRRQEQERVLKQQQTVTQNGFIEKLVAGTLTDKDVLRSNLDPVGSGSKEHYIQMMKARNSGEDAMKTDAATFRMLWDRMHLAPGDPKRLTDENEINQYVARGISFADAIHLRNEMQGKGTEAGSIENDLKQRVIKTAEGQLTKSNPLTGFKDPVGDEQLQKYMVFFLKEYKDQVAKGKSPTDLLDPDKPDYLGKYIGNYRRSPQEIMKDMTKSMKKPVIIPLPVSEESARKPGESAADFLKRTKGGK